MERDWPLKPFNIKVKPKLGHVHFTLIIVKRMLARYYKTLKFSITYVVRTVYKNHVLLFMTIKIDCLYLQIIYDNNYGISFTR